MEFNVTTQEFMDNNTMNKAEITVLAKSYMMYKIGKYKKVKFMFLLILSTGLCFFL